ncbi:hypothetical protein SPRG_03105 [Saprolegnia parasitica CBS 223.65]|uniref:RING-type domain-containing protein n=1 Tax=Saprolegnia parasitica (strain CBS 223.65) TaxID=695850 RepID=A0A067CMF6_SAPPC|nr:hypothetical protein SPRG_03105 [Saprolegnia parasitica CBS 223.65]KDO31889.1 hypothetical protein SPRG_03105 [Saprolegnia parasitica CBS 223.65]|eukprot:XP_012197088.1 hypothetical protein SPRG_03105 [Saprolegnia parasitica CBS 223.65]
MTQTNTTTTPTWQELAGDKPELDLFLVCDTTGSMGTYLPALQASLRQVFALAKLMYHDRLKVHIVSFKDYCDGDMVLSSVSRRQGRNDAIVKFVDDLRPTGGGDWPEAVKTALNFVVATVDELRAQAASGSAIVFLYTDAPPHHATTQSNNMTKEMTAIAANPAYRAGHDWCSIQKTLREADIPVFTFHSPLRNGANAHASPSFYALLGPVVVLPTLSSTVITKATIGLLLQLMDEEVDEMPEFARTSYFHGTTPFNETLIVPMRMPFTFASIPAMHERLDALLPLFAHDAGFRNLVMKTFEVIFRPDNIAAVTYNPVFGKLWRLACRQRLDPRLDDLTTQLSRCVDALPADGKALVQEWLIASYDDSARIQGLVDAAPAGAVFVMAAGAPTVAGKHLRSLARAPTAGALASVTSILSHLQLYATATLATDDGTPGYLPSTLSNDDLFACLPHLVCPGTSFSRRGAAVLALLCCLSDHTLLKARAEAYLASIRGSWLPFELVIEFPEIVSTEFIQLLYRGRAHLTEHEQAVYTQLYLVHRLRCAATKDVGVTLGFSPTKTQLWPDTKARCRVCAYETSCSLMVEADLCAMCVTYGDDAPRLQAETVVVGDTSHLVECVDCHGVYAVLQVHQLATHPKCWYCRTNQLTPAPKIECHTCLNSYVDPAGLYKQQCNDDTDGLWTCPVCVTAPSRGTEASLTTLSALVLENAALLEHFGWSRSPSAFLAMALDPKISLLKMFTTKYDDLMSATDDSPSSTPEVRVGGKRAHGADGLVTKVRSLVLTEALRDVCNLCFEDHSLATLHSACGRCATKCCDSCLSRWYGAVQPGKMVLASNLGCPFCRRVPTLGVLRKHNRQACALVASKMTWCAEMYYGWCLGCYKVKELAERNCAVEPPVDVETFRCNECIDGGGEPNVCPGCFVETEKTGGCNHMTCVCGQHWCFACGAGFATADDVYDHLYEVHRGIGNDQ